MEKNNEEIDLTFKVKKDELLAHIVNRSSLNLSQVKEIFDKNPDIHRKYINTCFKLTRSMITKGLQQCDDIIDFAEDLEKGRIK